MNAGILATTWMCLILSQSPDDNLEYTNQRNLKIPVKVDEAARKDIREFLLYVSTDQGQNWQQAGAISGDKDFFAFYATRDGSHWLRVAVVSRAGVQDPDDKAIRFGPPDMKMVIDTLQPIIRTINAQRHQDEIYVNWEIQEDHPARDGITLEYQVKDSSSATWTPVPVTSGVNGQARFRPGHSQALIIRLSVRDMANNQSFALSEVAGTIPSASGLSPANNITNPTPMPVSSNISKDPILPGEIKIPLSSHDSVKTVNPNPVPPSIIPGPPPIQRMIPPPTDLIPNQAILPAHTGPAALPAPPREALLREAPVREAPPSVVADSRIPPTPEPVKTTRVAPPNLDDPLLKDSLHAAKQVVNAAPARKPLPTLMYVNNHQVTLEYELKRVGPSGVGTVELWLTRDDGESWERYATAQDAQNDAPVGRQKRTFDFRDNKTEQPFENGIFGLNLVIKNRAGIGREPRPGDVPEIRIEIDTLAPVAVLYQPIPDPQRPDHILLRWFAKDKNLTSTPINLEFAEKRDGPWLPIQLDLENKSRSTTEEISGEFSWKVPTDIPVQVFLRLRVRDKAGNESIAVTSEPQYVDLTEPEGALIGVQPAGKQP